MQLILNFSDLIFHVDLQPKVSSIVHFYPLQVTNLFSMTKLLLHHQLSNPTPPSTVKVFHLKKSKSKDVKAFPEHITQYVVLSFPYFDRSLDTDVRKARIESTCILFDTVRNAEGSLVDYIYSGDDDNVNACFDDPQNSQPLKKM